MLWIHLLTILVCFAGGIRSSPTSEKRLLSGPVAPLDSTKISSYIPYSFFASAAYCPPSSQAAWNCKSCQADSVKDLIVYASGGDGGLVPFWYVGWWPSGQSIVVAHQGTETNDTNAILNDLDLIPLPTDPSLFPGASPLTLAHAGFQKAHRRTASAILGAVKKIIAEHSVTMVTTTGHSLGGALALLEGLFLRSQLPPTIRVLVRTFGQPRVGNDGFAQYVDQTIPDLARITLKQDPVPVLPPLTLSYRHSSGEAHLNDQNLYNACSGRDNMNTNCSTGEVLVRGIKVSDHLGPYPGGVIMGTGEGGSLC